jgi:myo-inositol-hexaphosphate 3-phosphohydrolase
MELVLVISFPFSDRGGCRYKAELLFYLLHKNNTGFEQNIYTNSALRTNGFKIQSKRLSNALAGDRNRNYIKLYIIKNTRNKQN